MIIAGIIFFLFLILVFFGYIAWGLFIANDDLDDY
jgi:hypothetical protein